MGKVYCIMGKSASGKDSVYHNILESCPGLKEYVMYSTRPMRDGEKDGVTYHFVDDAVLKKAKEEGKLIESRTYDTVYGPWTYATVDDGQIDLEKASYLMPSTLESYLSLKKYFGAEKTVPVYVEVEDGERLLRAISREKKQDVPKYAEMCRRFLADCEDFSEDRLKEAGITRRFENDHIGRVTKEIADMICGDL